MSSLKVRIQKIEMAVAKRLANEKKEEPFVVTDEMIEEHMRKSDNFEDLPENLKNMTMEELIEEVYRDVEETRRENKSRRS